MERPVYSHARLFCFSGFGFGLQLVTTSLSVLLVPERVAYIVGPQLRGTAVGIIASLAGLLSGLTNPFVGSVSDKFASRWGRRTPFLMLGALVTVLAFVPFALAGQFSFPGQLVALALSYTVLSMGTAIGAAPFSALIPDLVSPVQFGVASGYLGLMNMFGNAVGAGVLGLLSPQLTRAFGFYFLPTCVILCLLLVTSLLVTVLAVRERPHVAIYSPRLHASPSPPLSLSSAACSRSFFALFFSWIVFHFRRLIVLPLVHIWREFITPFRSRDFFWVFWTKFLMMSAVVSVQNFLQFWIEDMFPAPYVVFGVITLQTAASATAMFLLPLLVGAMISSIVAGWMSDRFGRKLMVYISGGIQAATALLMVFAREMSFVVILGLLFGLGFGAFLAVDYALATEALPSRNQNAAKDMGIFHLSTTFASVVSPAVAGMVLDFFKSVGLAHFQSPALGYRILFSLAASLYVLSTVLISLVSVGGAPSSAASISVVQEIPLEETSSSSSSSSSSPVPSSELSVESSVDLESETNELIR